MITIRERVKNILTHDEVKEAFRLFYVERDMHDRMIDSLRGMADTTELIIADDERDSFTHVLNDMETSRYQMQSRLTERIKKVTFKTDEDRRIMEGLVASLFLMPYWTFESHTDERLTYMLYLYVWSGQYDQFRIQPLQLMSLLGKRLGWDDTHEVVFLIDTAAPCCVRYDTDKVAYVDDALITLFKERYAKTEKINKEKTVLTHSVNEYSRTSDAIIRQ